MSDALPSRPPQGAPPAAPPAGWRARVRAWLVERYSVHARAERDASERRLGLLFERSSEGLLVCGAHGQVDACNPAAAQLLGVPAEALRGAALQGPMPRT